MIISIAVQKGGVGKTTTAYNLATGLAMLDQKVLLVSLESQGNLNDFVGYEEPESRNLKGENMTGLIQSIFNNQNVHVDEAIHFIEKDGFWYIPSNITIETLAMTLGASSPLGIANDQYLVELFKLPQFSNFDYIIMDCKPSLDLLLANAVRASDGIIIPATPNKFSLDGVEPILSWLKGTGEKEPLNKVVGFLITVADRRSNDYIYTHQLLERTYGKEKVFTADIPYLPREQRDSIDKKEALVKNQKSEIGKAYFSLAKEVIKKTKKSPNYRTDTQL